MNEGPQFLTPTLVPHDTIFLADSALAGVPRFINMSTLELFGKHDLVRRHRPLPRASRELTSRLLAQVSGAQGS